MEVQDGPVSCSMHTVVTYLSVCSKFARHLRFTSSRRGYVVQAEPAVPDSLGAQFKQGWGDPFAVDLGDV